MEKIVLSKLMENATEIEYHPKVTEFVDKTSSTMNTTRVATPTVQSTTELDETTTTDPITTANNELANTWIRIKNVFIVFLIVFCKVVRVRVRLTTS